MNDTVVSAEVQPTKKSAFVSKPYSREDKIQKEEEELKQIQQLKKEFASEIMEFTNAQMEQRKESHEAELAIINEQEQRELERIRNTTAYKLASDKLKEKMEKKIVDAHEKRENDLKKKTNERIKEQFRIQQALNIAQSVMNTAEAYTKALPNVPLSIAVAALGAIQVGMIAAQNPPTMRYGGIIGGEPHSRGGTTINAERGEFVMRREAVNAIGIENLNRMNQGGATSNVNIVFEGNVLSKDFIEDEAIPQIKEAIRRGADIGIG